MLQDFISQADIPEYYKSVLSLTPLILTVTGIIGGVFMFSPPKVKEENKETEDEEDNE